MHLRRFTSRLAMAGLLLGAAAGALAEGAGMHVRYLVHGGTVYDKKQDLTWARCSVGQDWDDRLGCVGQVRTMTFAEAQRQAAGGWRVPAVEELVLLVDQPRRQASKRPTIDIEAFPATQDTTLWYWSSTPVDAVLAAGTASGWGVAFDEGRGGFAGTNTRGAVRLVRSGY